MRGRRRGWVVADNREHGEPIIDLRGDQARYYGAKPPSTYGYDSVLPPAWRGGSTPIRGTRRRETPSAATRQPLPRRFRLGRRFPPLERVVHFGPVDGADVDVKLTVLRSILLHSTGIEHAMRDLEGRLRDSDYLQLLVDAFGLNRRSLGTQIVNAPASLDGAKREWHKSITARSRHGFALAGNHLVVLEYLPPERDIRRPDFGIAYKRVIVAYEIEVSKR